MDEEIYKGLSEFLSLNPLNETPAAVQTVIWTINQTKIFLDLYKKYKPKIGTFQIKNNKRLWEILAQELNKMLNTNLTPSHCENRWRVLERAYKKYIDTQNKTGQGKKYFEYLDDMDEIFKGKKNVTTVVLLSNTTIEKEPEVEMDEESSTLEPSTPRRLEEKDKLKVNRQGLKRRITPVINRNVTLENMRKDRRDYQEERLKLEKSKLELQKEKLKVIQERNLLLKERNELLKQRECVVCKEFE